MNSDFLSDFPLRSWETWSSAIFRKTKEDWGGYSNMCGGYPIVVNDRVWLNSEALYQAMRFPDYPDVQEIICKEKSPMAAKMKSKPFRQEKTRHDWDEVRVDVMWWCLVAKYQANPEIFGKLLKDSKSAEIVEYSHRDQFWGAVRVSDDYLQGQNVLGVLLARLRRKLITDSDEELAKILPPSGSKIFGNGEFIITRHDGGGQSQLSFFDR